MGASPPQRIGFRIAVLYALVAGAWILLSDLVLGLVTDASFAFSVGQSLKGVLFVLVTAVGLALLIARASGSLRQAEKAREEEAARLAALVDQLPALVWSVDRDLVVTAAYGTDFREEPAALVGRRLPELLAPGQEDKVLPAVRRALDGILAGYDVVSQRGRTYETVVQPLRDRSGTVTGAVAVSTDVTERRQAESAFAAIFDNALLPIVMLDDRRHVVEANRAAAVLLGLGSKDELVGRPLDDFTVEGARDRLDELWRLLLENGSLTGEYVLRRLDGTTVAVEFTATANVQPGRHLALTHAR